MKKLVLFLLLIGTSLGCNSTPSAPVTKDETNYAPQITSTPPVTNSPQATVVSSTPSATDGPQVTNHPQSSATPQTTATPQPSSSPELQQQYVAAWLAPYDYTRGLSSFTANINLFSEINPVWYNLNPNYFTAGAAPFTVNSKNKATIINLAQANRIKLLPTIQNFGVSVFDATGISKIINNSTLRAQHVREISQLVMAENYDGIDIDYENLAAADRQRFSTFITELGNVLHQHGKLLSVTLHAKTNDNVNWAGPGAQDWATIAEAADSIKIMAYDYHWCTFHAGPLTPVDWLRDILKYAQTVTKAHGKVIIGLPLYGLDWASGSNAREIMYQDAQVLLNNSPYYNFNRAAVDHSANPICGKYMENVELHFQYQASGSTHTVYFQDAAAIREWLKLINQYHTVVKGITFWRLGGEDPDIWKEIK